MEPDRFRSARHADRRAGEDAAAEIAGAIHNCVAAARVHAHLHTKSEGGRVSPWQRSRQEEVDWSAPSRTGALLQPAQASGLLTYATQSVRDSEEIVSRGRLG